MIDLTLFGLRIRIERFKAMRLSPLPQVINFVGVTHDKPAIGKPNGRQELRDLPPAMGRHEINVYDQIEKPIDMRHLTMPSGGPQ